MKHTVLLIDGYIDDPAALGVPPYISPIVRSVAGAAKDSDCDVIYLTIDKIRNGEKIPKCDVSVVVSGNTVPGKYIRSMPMSLKELDRIIPELGGWKLIGGSAADSEIAKKFDFAIKKDLAASLYDGLQGKEVDERFRTLEEWNRWMILGAEIVKQHQDYPFPLIVELESYRGCHRYASGGCSYCIEPLKGKPLMRSPTDIIEEAETLKNLGIRNVRLGGQTCIVSYGSKDDAGTPRPNPDAVGELFEGMKKLNFDVFHVDNANPAVISEYPEESEKILETIAECCTPGNVLALGMESSDINVINANNLNSTPKQVYDAVKLINKIGNKRGDNGMPLLLPGLNFIAGLDGETPSTYESNKEFLKKLLDENLLTRRINIRQVLPVRRSFETKVNQSRFKKYKQEIRETIDRKMLEKMIPEGTVLKNVYMEINDGNNTFGRQIGSYPLLIGVPYKLDCGKCYDIVVTDWGYRSITGIEYPFKINKAPMSAISCLPGIGKKRAALIVKERPYVDFEEMMQKTKMENVLASIEKIISILSFSND